MLRPLGLYSASNADKKYYWLFREKPQGIQRNLVCGRIYTTSAYVSKAVPAGSGDLLIQIPGKKQQTKKQSSTMGRQSMDRIQFLSVFMSPGV